MSILDDEDIILEEIDDSMLRDCPLEEYPTVYQAWFDILEEAYQESLSKYYKILNIYVKYIKPYEFVRLLHYKDGPHFLITTNKDKMASLIWKISDIDKDTDFYMNYDIFKNEGFHMIVDRAKQENLLLMGFFRYCDQYKIQYQIDGEFRLVKNRYKYYKSLIQSICDKE